jgi:hypothetical protein
MVRVVFERDGETWIEGSAMRWDRTRVCVTVNDVLLSSGYVWVRGQRRAATRHAGPSAAMTLCTRTHSARWEPS